MIVPNICSRSNEMSAHHRAKSPLTISEMCSHTKDCPKCRRGEGHQVFVLTVTYPGSRTRQYSVRREKVAEVRRWLENYQRLKEAIENICELNHDVLFESPRRRARALRD